MSSGLLGFMSSAGALIAALLPAPWGFVPPAAMTGLVVMDVVLATLMVLIVGRVVAVGWGIAPLVTCTRRGHAITIHVANGVLPQRGARLLIDGGGAQLVRMRVTTSAGSTRRSIVCRQAGQSTTLVTLFEVDDAAIAPLVACAARAGLELRVS